MKRLTVNVDRKIPGSPNNIIVSYGGEPDIYFRIIKYKNTPIRLDPSKTSYTPNNTFTSINAVLELLDERSLDHIYSLYKNIKNRFIEVRDCGQLTSSITGYCCQLVDYIPQDTIRGWFESEFHKGRITIPDSVPDSYESKTIDDAYSSPEKTYTRQQYVDLICASISLRLLVPVIGEFKSEFHREIEDRYRDSRAYQLIKDSEVIGERSSVYQRMYIYYKETTKKSTPEDKKKAQKAIVLLGMSELDFNYWLCQSAVITKLPFVSITPNTKNKSHAISILYRHIGSKISPTNSKISRVKDKVVQTGGVGDEDKSSYLENYITTTTISGGKICETEFMLNNICTIYKELCPGYPMEVLEDALDNVQRLSDVNIRDAQITLVSWTLSEYLLPEVILYLDKEYILKAIAITQAALWNRGFKYLACIVSAIGNEPDEFTISTVEGSYKKPPISLIKQLEEKYPHTLEKGATIFDRYPVQGSMRDVAKDIMDFIWTTTIGEKYLIETFNAVITEPNVPRDIKIDLVKLILNQEKEEM